MLGVQQEMFNTLGCSEVAEGGASFGLWVLENGIGFAWCSSKWIP